MDFLLDPPPAPAVLPVMHQPIDPYLTTSLIAPDVPNPPPPPI
jgi:hypothetical protein